MADLQQFSVTSGSAVQVTTMDWIIACLVQDGETVLSDFTGANALHYPSVLSTLTLAQQEDLLRQIANQIIFIKAGLAE